MAANLERLAREFYRAGYPEMALGANALCRLARKLHAPEYLPLGIERFSEGQREALRKQGLTFFYEFKGKSIGTLRDIEGCRFGTTWHKAFPYLEALPSMRSEVAINPNKLFLPNSNNKGLDQEEEMVKEYSWELERKVQGVRAIIGQVSDYAELAIAYQKSTGGSLFGKKADFVFARTKTPTRDSNVADIRDYGEGYGLSIDDSNRHWGHSNMFAVPLVVPV